MNHLLLINLGNYFVTTQGGFCPQRIEALSKKFDKITVLCIGNKKANFSRNVEVFAWPVWKWPKILFQKFSHVFINDYTYGGFIGTLNAKLHQTHLALRIGGTWEHKNRKISSLFKNIFIKLTKKFIYRNAKNIIYNSKYIQKEVDPNNNYPSSIVYNGVDAKLFTPGRKKPNTLLFVGRVREDKGLLYLRDAMKKLPNYTLNIIGSGPLEEELNKEKNITCLGRISHKELPKIYSTHEIFVFPSLSESSESFPSAVLEAMASDMKIVATNIAGISEMLGKEGTLIPEKNVEALITGIINVKKKEPRRRVLAHFQKEKQMQDMYTKLFKK